MNLFNYISLFYPNNSINHTHTASIDPSWINSSKSSLRNAIESVNLSWIEARGLKQEQYTLLAFVSIEEK